MSDRLAMWQAWLPRQRWFAGKGRPATVVADTAVDVERTPSHVVRVHLVGVSYDGTSTPTETYQVPVVLRPAEQPASAGALIAAVDEPDGTTWYAYDGPHDPAFAAAVLGLLAHDRWDVRWAAAEVLAERGDLTALEPLRRVQRQETDPLVRQVVASAVARLEGLAAASGAETPP